MTTCANCLPACMREGYGAGERPIPDVPQAADLKIDFGAKGDGVTDDTQVGCTPHPCGSEPYSGPHSLGWWLGGGAWLCAVHVVALLVWSNLSMKATGATPNVRPRSYVLMSPSNNLLAGHASASWCNTPSGLWSCMPVCPQAFLTAVEQVASGAIYIPPGRWVQG